MSEEKRRIKTIGGWCVFGVVVLVIWGLYSVPGILYFSMDFGTDGTSEQSGCVQQTYTGVCREHLLKYQTCRCGSNGTVANGSLGEAVVCVPSSQQHQEATARNAILNLSLLNPSPECEAELADFICLNLFGVCADSGEVVRPSSGQCERLRTDVCAAEWETAVDYEQGSADDQYNFESILINCDTLPNTTKKTADNTTNCSEARTECSSGFYRDGGQCVPECGEWKEHSKTTTIIVDTIAIPGACMFLVGAVIVLVVSCTYQRNMCQFPSVLLLYQMLGFGVYEIVLLISYTDQKALLCSHRNYMEALTDPTAFCYITGGLGVFVAQMALSLLLSHILVVLWGIVFPFHARRTLDNPKKRRCVHVTILLFTTISSLILLAATIGFGEFITRFPPGSCVASSLATVYYLQVLPLTIMSAAAATSLILAIWLLIMDRKSHQRAVKKILLILVHIMALSLILLIGFVIELFENESFQEEIEEYFACEAAGMESCSRSQFERFDNTVYTLTTVWIVSSTFPVVVLAFMASGNMDCKMFWAKLLRVLKIHTHTAQSTVPTALSLQQCQVEASQGSEDVDVADHGDAANGRPPLTTTKPVSLQSQNV